MKENPLNSEFIYIYQYTKEDQHDGNAIIMKTG